MSDSTLSRLEKRESKASRKYSRRSSVGTEVSVRPDITKARDEWSSQVDFLLSCLGYAVGLANIWRFPFLAHTNGGGAFLIPYIIMIVCVGLPIFVLELSLGQFSSSGPVACWELCPLFKGVGAAMALVSGLTAVYYNIIICWAIIFLINSFQSEVPWMHCGNWSTPMCRERVRQLTVEDCVADNATVNSDGTCTPYHDPEAVWIWNRTLAYDNGFTVTFAVMEYFQRKVSGIAFGSLSSLGLIRRDMFVTLLFAWVIVFLCLFKGVKTSGKVAYVSALCPYLMLVGLFIRGIILEGAGAGVLYYITPQLEHLKTGKIWKDAAVQVFFSSASSYGGLITLASYNKFQNDVIRDSLLVSFGDCFTSIFAGFVIFSFLGFLSHHLSMDIHSIAKPGPALAFGVYPYLLTEMPRTSVWSVIFFVMLLLLGLDTQLVLVETVLTTILDSSPVLRDHKVKCVAIVCLFLFILGIPMTTDGGSDVLDLMDMYAGGWNVFFISVCECIAVAWIYGVDRFLKDINLMLGGRCCCFTFNSACQKWWALCWKYITPCTSMGVVIISWVDYHRIDRFPIWADLIGMLITLSGILCIVCTAFYHVYKAPAGRFKEKLRHATTPSKYWGPARIIDRLLVRAYVPDLVIDPDAVPEEEDVETSDAKDVEPDSFTHRESAI